METTRIADFYSVQDLAVWLSAQNADGFTLRALLSHNKRLVAVVVKVSQQQ